MDEKANYVTQQGLYSSPLLGPLTNRRIAKYQKLGYYKVSAIVFRKEERKKRSKSKKSDFLKELLKGLKS